MIGTGVLAFKIITTVFQMILGTTSASLHFRKTITAPAAEQRLFGSGQQSTLLSIGDHNIQSGVALCLPPRSRHTSVRADRLIPLAEYFDRQSGKSRNSASLDQTSEFRRRFSAEWRAFAGMTYTFPKPCDPFP